jgi:hypothetical protein
VRLTDGVSRSRTSVRAAKSLRFRDRGGLEAGNRARHKAR